jgi:hypothetical protein
LIGGGSAVACLLALLLAASIAAPNVPHQRVTGGATATTISLHQTVGGFDRLTDPASMSLAQHLTDSFSDFDGQASSAAVYGSTGGQARVAVLAGTHPTWLQKNQREFIASSQRSLRSHGLSVTSIQDIGPGPRGGIMSCAAVPDRANIVCIFASPGTFGVIDIIDNPGPYTAVALRVRSDIEHRSPSR